jgi:hypothetical protein
MILYQLAKRMEERNRLTESLKNATGDVSFLQHKIEQIEGMIISEAARWLGPHSADEWKERRLPEDTSRMDEIMTGDTM